MKEKDFKERYRVDVSPDREIINLSEKRLERKFEETSKNATGIPIERFPSVEQMKRNPRYAARKGSAHRASEKKPNHKKINGKALLLAAMIFGGAITMRSCTADRKDKGPDIPTLIEQGVDIGSLGLKQETIDQILEYREYFETTDAKSASKSELLQRTSSLQSLVLSTIKQKMSTIDGKPEENHEIEIYSDKNDGTNHTVINVYDEKFYLDDQTQRPVEKYHGSDDVFQEKNDKNLPDELCGVAWEWNTLDVLYDNIDNSKISPVNAYKKLKESFEKLEEFSSKELIKDEKGNLAIVNYGEGKEIAQNKAEDIERD